jgi:hypothetical protein
MMIHRAPNVPRRPRSSAVLGCPSGVSSATTLATALSISWAAALIPASSGADAAPHIAPPAPGKAPLQIQLSDIANGKGGFVIDGQDGTDAVGAVSSAGDVNGDGLEDLIIGAPRGSKAYVVFGKKGTTRVKLSDVAAGKGGFVINGGSNIELAGINVSLAGDINGDGLADVIVHAPAWYAGRDYVILGKTDTAAVELSDVESGTGGFVIQGFSVTPYDSNVSAIGDFNGDGLADLLVETATYWYYHRPGAAYVIFGKTDTKPVNVNALGAGGVSIGGGWDVGEAVAGVGDVNGDGLADIVLGSTYEYYGFYFSSAYVVFGRTGTTPIKLSDVHNGIGGFEMDGANYQGDGAGFSVGPAGDLNGDGLADMIVGAPAWSSNGGAYVVFGKTDTQRVDLAQVAAGQGGFVVNGTTDVRAGWWVSGAGDINADGLGDVIVGNNIVFGKSDTAPVQLADVALQIGGIAVAGNGGGLTAAGDVNGDGLSDLVIADGGFAPGGRTYVIFGGIKGAFKKGTQVDQLGGNGDDTINGTHRSDVLVGGAGNDLIDGMGDGDTIYGGSGDDVLMYGLAGVQALSSPYGCCGNIHNLSRADGGTGNDTLQLFGGGITMDLGLIASQGAGLPFSVSRLESIERIDITGSGDNKLILGIHDVQDIVGMNRINAGTQAGLGWTNGTFTFPAKNRRHQLVVDGNAGDVLELRKAASGWVNAGTAFHGGVQYTVYDSGTAGKQFERVEVIVASDVTTIVDTTEGRR